MIDSTIRVRQMNQPELSGFVIPMIQALLANTGSLTGIFYPLFQNPQNYAHSGDFISQVDLDSAVTQALSYVAQNFYPNSNPSGFSTGISSGGSTPTGQLTGVFYPLSSNPAGYLNSGNLPSTFSGYNISLTGNQLFDQNNILALDYNNRLLWDFDGFSSLDWFDRYALDFAGNTSVDWGARQLIDFQGNVALDWFNRNLSGSWTGQYANFTSGLQVSGQSVLTGSLASFITTGQTGSFASTGSLNATGSLLSAWTGASTGLYYPLNSNPLNFAFDTGVAHITGNETINGNKTFSNLAILNGGVQMGDAGGGVSQPITNSSFSDSIFLGIDILTTGLQVTNATVNWKSGLLLNNNSVNLNWMTQNLFGSWNGNFLNLNSGLTVSGNHVVTGGPYYLASNPSGYITSGQTGVFATTGNLNTTGANLSGLITNNYLLSSTAFSTYATIANLNATGTGIANWTGLSTGLYYPRTSNPSGYVTTGQTGSFITSGQTGIFATTGNLTATGSTLQSQVTTLNAWTGSSTGLYYPLSANPLGYITSGSSVGLFYPLTTNPARYLSSFNSSPVPFIANGSIVIMPGYDVLTDAAGNPILDAAGNYITSQTTGNLGVNQFNPQYTMDVGGSGNFSSGVYWNGNPVVTGGQWNNLTFNTGTTVWNAQQNVAEDRKILVLTGSTTLGISGLYNGWAGVLETIQSGSGFNLTLPSGTKVAYNSSGVVSLTTGISGAIDMISFMYNGTTLFASIANNFS